MMKDRFITIGLKLCQGMTVAAMVLTALLPLPITYDALMRATGYPTIWVFQITLYAFIAAGFLANPAAMISGAHFRITVLHTLFPRLRRPLNIFAMLVTLVFSVVLIGTGTYFVHYSWADGIVSASLFEVPMWIPQLAIPLGGIGLFISTLVILIRGGLLEEDTHAPMDLVRD